MNKNESAWEKRSILMMDKKEAVMDQSFPPELNNYIHKIHIEAIENLFVKSKHYVCLDMGCGYGRIAEEVAYKYNAFIYGIDISTTFVKLFNQKLKSKGKAFVASANKLPFKDNTFDIAWIVVTLMYFPQEKEQEGVMKEIFRVLKPDGKVIIIEPNSIGENWVRLWGLAPFIYRTILGKKKKAETLGVCFPWGGIDKLIRNCGHRIIEKRGFPFLTLFLNFILISGKFSPTLARHLISFINKLDNLVNFPIFSYFVIYTAEKNT